MRIKVHVRTRFVHVRDEYQHFVKILQLSFPLGFYRQETLPCTGASPQYEIQFLPDAREFHTLLRGQKAHPNRFELMWIKLLGLDEHMFADPDLSKIMEQRRISQFLEILRP